ncbi:MAG: hypothetical protein B9S32_04305 [Verrucomicrobia bacterium Tous-C9LFEB]|nr:MAG: hypothetical protein B9S32_04305 [Verrucomicrobia bacterium Tous-C9LFEB]
MSLRLRRIRGQIQAIERMVDEDFECTEVLNQTISVRRALKSFAEEVIHQHVSHCIEGSETQQQARKRLQELVTVLKRYVE